MIFQRSARVKGIQVASAVTLLDGDRDAVADGRQFGETLAQVPKRAESAILDVRPAYDHAYIRAIQMALSIGMASSPRTML